MSGYTPGPWNGSRSSSSGYDIICAENSAVDVCVVSRRDKSQEEINANARLIAAAPELLDLAIAIFSAADNGNIANTSDEDSVGVLLDAARSAIAKATGEKA